VDVAVGDVVDAPVAYVLSRPRLQTGSILRSLACAWRFQLMMMNSPAR
jgi:hypothetical protein